MTLDLVTIYIFSKDGMKKNLAKLDKNKNLSEHLHYITTNESNKKKVPINVQLILFNFRFETFQITTS